MAVAFETESSSCAEYTIVHILGFRFTLALSSRPNDPYLFDLLRGESLQQRR